MLFVDHFALGHINHVVDFLNEYIVVIIAKNTHVIFAILTLPGLLIYEV